MQLFSDKMAIGLSLLCAMHCLAFPLLVVLLPTFATLPLNNESLHLWMLIAVFPTSVYALTLGCRKHQRYRLAIYGGFGLLVLVLAFLFGESIAGEAGEKALTVIGAGLIALGHYRNYRLCQQHDPCDCTGPDISESQ